MIMITAIIYIFYLMRHLINSWKLLPENPQPPWKKRIAKYFWKEKKINNYITYKSTSHYQHLKFIFRCFEQSLHAKIFHQLFTNLMLNLDSTYLKGR